MFFRRLVSAMITILFYYRDTILWIEFKINYSAIYEKTAVEEGVRTFTAMLIRWSASTHRIAKVRGNYFLHCSLTIYFKFTVYVLGL